jgi:hypothetical protein
MPTPNVKLLLHALRLGHPQEPQAAALALAEAATLQQDQIAALERALFAAAERERALVERVARLELALSARSSTTSPSTRPPAQSTEPANPVVPSAPVPTQAPLHRAPLESADEFAGETLVVRRSGGRTSTGPSNAAAPFAIAPPDPRRAAHARDSIPGAPWSRSAPQHSTSPSPTPQNNASQTTAARGAAPVRSSPVAGASLPQIVSDHTIGIDELPHGQPLLHDLPDHELPFDEVTDATITTHPAEEPTGAERGPRGGTQ